MGFDQYHEPPEELTQQTRTFARKGVLFHDGDIVELGEKAEEAEDEI